MLKHILLSTVILASAPAVASADDLDALCSFIKKASHDDQLGYTAMKDQLWQGMSCELPIENDLPDRYDSSVVVHVGRILQAFGDDASAEMMDRAKRKYSVVAYSLSKLDRAKFDKEIAKAPPAAKKLLGAAFDLAVAQGKVVTAWRAKQTKTSAKKVWQTGWTDAIAAVEQDWTSYGPDISLAIGALDKAKEGEPCPDVRSRLLDVIKAAAPKSKEDADTLVHRIDVDLLFAASAQCAAAADDVPMAALLGSVSEQLRLRDAFEGPSSQVSSLIVGRYKELRDRGTVGDTLEPGDASVLMARRGNLPRLQDNYPTRSDGNGHGLVHDAVYGEVTAKKAAKTKGWVTLTFKKIMITDHEVNCVDTNKVHRIDADGNLVYEQNCSYGKAFKVNVAPLPVEVPAALAEGIKPGNFVLISEIGNDQTKHYLGFPVELYANKSRKELIGLFGVRWK